MGKSWKHKSRKGSIKAIRNAIALEAWRLGHVVVPNRKAKDLKLMCRKKVSIDD
jgi:hypothetical protein|tara:strand:- start:290 stop:451 length:162 start_codon:yes stop_codon:yes gene_type:complete